MSLVLAASACDAVREGRSLNAALESVFTSPQGRLAVAQARAAAQDLAYFAMRYRARGDALLARMSDKPAAPSVLGELLVIALVVIDAKGGTHAPTYDVHTLVDQAVDAAGQLAGRGKAKVARGFVNAVLRRALRLGEAIFAAPKAFGVEAENYPQWWIDATMKAYPGQWQQILAAGQQPPPLTLRVNRRKFDISAGQDLLAKAGIASRALSASALVLDKPRPVAAIPGFSTGHFSVQDEAAQRAAPLLDVKDGQRVLDACAAPGGKSGHLLEIADIELTALDVEPQRLLRVKDNLERLGFRAALVAGDAATPERWWDGRPFARILADLPCSASGIVRRHPDIRWLRRPADIDALSRRQQHMLDALWRLLAPDGKLLLVTCSIFPQEGVLLAEKFTSRHADARPLPSPGQLLPETGVNGDHDGLFFSLIQKAS